MVGENVNTDLHNIYEENQSEEALSYGITDGEEEEKTSINDDSMINPNDELLSLTETRLVNLEDMNRSLGKIEYENMNDQQTILTQVSENCGTNKPNSAVYNSASRSNKDKLLEEENLKHQ